MAYIVSDIVTRVQQRIRDTAYSTTEIRNLLNDTQNDVFNEFKLPFMEASQDYTVTVDESDITNGVGLPANYTLAINLTYNEDGNERLIEYKDTKEIDFLYADPTDTTSHPAGQPRYWYYYAETIKVYPAPSEAYTVSLRYYKKPTALTTDDAVPSIPSEFEELLVFGAAYRVMQIKDNYDQAGVLENKYIEQLTKLSNRYAGQPQVGRPTVMRINKYALGKTNF